MNLFVSNNRAIIDILASKSRICFRVESRLSGNCRDEHTHWMCVISKVLHHNVDVLMDKCVCHHLFSPELELRNRREFSIDEQESDFQEVRFLCQLFDWNSSVLEDTLVSINETDLGGAINCVHVARIVTS